MVKRITAIIDQDSDATAAIELLAGIARDFSVVTVTEEPTPPAKPAATEAEHDAVPLRRMNAGEAWHKVQTHRSAQIVLALVEAGETASRRDAQAALVNAGYKASSFSPICTILARAGLANRRKDGNLDFLPLASPAWRKLKDGQRAAA